VSNTAGTVYLMYEVNLRLGFQVVIVDESHTLRTADRAPDSNITEATVAAVKASNIAMLLTGTPSLSRPFDLYRQVCT